MTGSYFAEVTRGLGGIMKCYIAGVQCFCNTLETVADELCGKKYCITLPQNPADKEIKEAEADFYKTLNKIFDPLFQKLETEAEKVGQKHGKSTQARVWRGLQKRLENEGQNWINKYIEEVPTHLATLLEETVAVKEAKENEAKSIQSLSQQVDLLKKENEDLRKTLKELSDNPPSKKM
jgi:hypothetical protein